MEYENAEINNNAFTFFRKYNEVNLSYLIVNKTDYSFKEALLSEYFSEIILIDEEKISLFSSEFLVGALPLVKSVDLKRNIIERCLRDAGEIKISIAPLLRESIILNDESLLMLVYEGVGSKKHKGLDFYYYLLLVIRFNSYEYVISYLRSIDKGYLVDKYDLYKELYKRSRQFNDLYLSNSYLNIAAQLIDDPFIGKKQIEECAINNMGFEEFKLKLSMLPTVVADRLLYLIDEGGVGLLKDFFFKNYRAYPRMSSYIYEVLIKKSVFLDVHCVEIVDFIIQRGLDSGCSNISVILEECDFNFNEKTWGLIKDTAYGSEYLSKVSCNSLEAQVALFQVEKKKKCFDKASIIARNLISETSGRKRMRNVLRLAECFEGLGKLEESLRILASISSDYFPAKEFVVSRELDLSPQERLGLLPSKIDGFKNKSDKIRYLKLKIKLEIEGKETSSLRDSIDDLIQWNAAYLEDLELRRLIVLSLYFIYEDFESVYRLVVSNNFNDKVSIVYKWLSCFNLERLEALSLNELDGEDVDLKLLAYNYHIKNNDRVNAKNILEDVLDCEFDNKTDLFNVESMTMKSNRKFKGGHKVSVIMTNYGFSEYVEKSIRSILDQTYVNFELLIIDDCSNAGAFQLLKDLCDYIDDPRIKLIRAKVNGGTYRAKNIGIRKAKGEYITFQDSDDYSHPERLERQILNIKKNSLLANTVRCFRLTKDEDVFFYRSGAVKKAPISLMIHRSCFKTLGYFNSVRVGADSEFLNRFKLVYGDDAISNQDDILYLASYHPQSLTSMGKTSLHPVLGLIGLRARFRRSYIYWHGLIQSGSSPYVSYGHIQFSVPEELC